jgi:hypothetical protein
VATIETFIYVLTKGLAEKIKYFWYQQKVGKAIIDNVVWSVQLRKFHTEGINNILHAHRNLCVLIYKLMKRKIGNYPQYFSQHVAFVRHGHCFPQAD